MLFGIVISQCPKTCHDSINKEINISSQRPTSLLLIAIFLLILAYESTFFGGALNLLGMEDRVARIAGSRLRVMAALVGAGLLLIGLSVWARNTRLMSVSQGHAALLEHLSEDSLGRVDVLPGVGAIFSGEVAGLRVEVAIEPINGGQVLVRAMSPVAVPVLIWPRGLPPASHKGEGFRVAQGPSWEAWSSDSAALQGELMGPIELVFLKAGATHIRHDNTGIEVRLPNAPGQDLMDRVQLGVDAAVALSRTNR